MLDESTFWLNRVYYSPEYEKIPGMPEETFVVVEDEGEARGVHRCNSYEDNEVRRERLTTILARGVVSEVDMPDVKRCLEKHFQEANARRRRREHSSQTKMTVFAHNVGPFTGTWEQCDSWEQNVGFLRNACVCELVS